ncbi:MAG TPA: FMN-binding protein [Acholeplasmataceae bacterium]|nr:FMN-binding protein [Acholeplasmataceae bacterium]
MSKPLKYGVFLLVLGVICAGLLAFINSFTAPIIEKREFDEVVKVLEEVDEDSNSFEDVTDEFDNLPASISKVFYGTKRNRENTVIYWTTTYGYNGGEIKVLTVIDYKTGVIKATKVTAAEKQTAGIGDKIITYDFKTVGRDAQFYAEKNVENIAESGLEIISGATVSSKAFLEGVIIASSHYVENIGD